MAETDADGRLWLIRPRLWHKFRPGRTATAIYLSIFSLLVIVTAISWLIYDSRRNLIDDAERTAMNASFFLADHATRLFEASDLALLEASNAATSMEWGEIGGSLQLWERLRGLSDRFPYIDNIWLNDASGELRLSTIAWPAPRTNAADRDFFQAHREPGSGLFIGKLIIGRVTNEASFLLSRRLEDKDGKLRGIVSLTIDLKYFETFYGSLHLRLDPAISLVRAADRSVLMRVTNEAPGMLPDLPIPADADQGLATLTHVADWSSPVHAWRKVERLPMYVSVAVPNAHITRAWLNEIWIYWLVGAAAALALWPLSIMAVRQARADRIATLTLEQRVEERTRQLVQANSQLETLFQEVHHRVKNNLQVITSLLRLQAARSADPETKASLQKSVDRIHAMSLVHHLLYSSKQMTDVDFATYLGELVANLQSAYDNDREIAVEIDVGNAWFPLNQAIPLCLIVNEVLSNAFKHAFPDGLSGLVRIRMRQEEDGGPWELTISDNGIGLPDGFDPKRGKGLGMQIIRSLVGQLDGTMGFDGEGSAGATFRLRF